MEFVPNHDPIMKTQERFGHIIECAFNVNPDAAHSSAKQVN